MLIHGRAAALGASGLRGAEGVVVAELVFIACVVGIVTEALHGFLVGVGVHTEGFEKLDPRTRSAAVPSLAEPLVCA